MPFFKVEHENRIIITNFKVMFTSFKYTQNLRKIKRYKAYFNIMLTAPDVYFTARNPYAKAMSFYKDKFQKIPARVDTTKNFKWEKPQRVFFPLLGLDTRKNSTAEIKQTLLSTSFESYVDMLSHVYHLDEHINPQHWILNHPHYLMFKNLGISKSKLQIFQIENKLQMQKFSTLTHFDINQKANNTHEVVQEDIIGQVELDKLNQIYAEDFAYFGYEKC